MTMGGNDLLAVYGDAAARQAIQTVTHNGQVILAGLRDLMGSQAPIVVATVYDPSDGSGDGGRLGLLAWPEALELLAGLDWAGPSTNMLRSHDADEIFGTHRAELHEQFDLGAFASVIRRARTSGLLGSSKWLTPGLSVRLKCQQLIALQALTASFVMSSWLMSPSRVKNWVVPVTN